MLLAILFPSENLEGKLECLDVSGNFNQQTNVVLFYYYLNINIKYTFSSLKKTLKIEYNSYILQSQEQISFFHPP